MRHDAPRTDPSAWLAKADADLASAEALLATHSDRVTLNACYMAQQCIEKSLKAMLVTRAIEPPKTHDLGRLLILLGESGGVPPGWDVDTIDDATQYAIESRYPGHMERISRPDVELVIELARTVRATAG